MTSDPSQVREILRLRILDGYDPTQDLESAEDHDVDWLVLSREEFDRLKRAARVEFAARRARGPAPALNVGH